MIATFDPARPAPQGITVLEASAGTGKTHTVGSLVARYVAEGVCPLDHMLVITFGRAASQELRERVRAQLVEVAHELADPEQARGRGGVVAHLATGDPVEIGERRRRVLDALASFDSATIATTHQFCHIVLRSLGVAGDTDPGVTLVEDLDDLLVEVVDDLILGRYRSLDKPPFTRAAALALARAVVNDPHTVLTPTDPELGSASQERIRFAQAVRAEVDRRKQQRGLVSFDDLLMRLNVALEDPASPARERMRARWSVVLVDEFQDTDPVQWEVLDRAFGGQDPASTMVLIGDPKQAIYAFRGGDIDSYLAGRRSRWRPPDVGHQLSVGRAAGRRAAGPHPRSPAGVPTASRCCPSRPIGRPAGCPVHRRGRRCGSGWSIRRPMTTPCLASEQFVMPWRSISPTRSPDCSRRGPRTTTTGTNGLSALATSPC